MPMAKTTPEANINGSIDHIAGITNKQKNVLGMMPHPERAMEKLLGKEDGKPIFESIYRRWQLRERKYTS